MIHTTPFYFCALCRLHHYPEDSEWQMHKMFCEGGERVLVFEEVTA